MTDDELEASPTKFGHAMREQFMLARGYTNFNHGSYGATPNSVMAVKRALEERAESVPDQWMREDFYNFVEEARGLIASYVGADAQDVVLVENDTCGINAVLRSFPWQQGDKMLIFSTAYKMVQNLAKHLSLTKGVSTLEVEIPFPVPSQAAVVEATAAALESAGLGVRLAVFSHITSATATIFPVAEMTRLCQAKGVQVLVDGAHAIGHVPLDLNALNADYYVSNLHKWFYAPKTSAFLWTRRDRQTELCPQPGAISMTGRLDYVGRFMYTGTRDYTAFAAIPIAFEFRRKHGDERIRRYIMDLAHWGGAHLAEAWGTRMLAPKDMTPFMTCVELPTSSTAVAEQLQQALLTRHNTFVVVNCVGGVVFTRLSAQIYLERQDFQRVGQLVLELVQEFTVQ